MNTNTLVPCVTKETPQQKDGVSCGIFVCMFADLISMDSPLVFDHSHIDKYRNWIAIIISGDHIICYER